MHATRSVKGFMYSLPIQRPLLLSIVAVLALCLFPSREGLAHPPSSTRLGVKMGLHSTFLSNLETFDTSGTQVTYRALNGAIGLVMYRELHPRLELEAGGYIAGRGYARRARVWEGGQPNDQVNLEYIQVSGLLHAFPLGSFAGVAPKVSAGLYAGVLYRTNLSQYMLNPLSDIGLREEDLNPLDYGYILSAGVDIALDRVVLSLEARYEQGLSDIHRGADVSHYHDVIGGQVGMSF